MIQGLIVGALFIGAIVYIVRTVIKQSKAKSSCGSAACKCDPKSKEAN